ncbi:LOB domain-containing protein 2 [Phtheirospermum japonicum]|uniref:LOB domain-containing protein 2 n=1 Tax=Phtheirospermum japonicum TaxID=374723 RepID=A0A830B3G9_9LAMI|nr:LOB domain-containing protein 2 [Phtheirospermum japonicum]
MQRSNGGGPSACASCKHQRKKCTNKCVLAPFFPVEKTREFQAVHKVFGVSNVTKIITNLKDEERRVAVDSLVWEALCRQKDPVRGPYGDYQRICEESIGLMGWSNNNNNSSKVMSINNNNNNNNNNFHGPPGNSVVEFCPYAYSSSQHHIQDTAEKLRVGMENGSSALILPQQHLPNGFSQQYILAGNMVLKYHTDM